MRPLLPTLRDKKRYVVIEGHDKAHAIAGAYKELYGSLALARCGYKPMKSQGQRFLVRIRRDALDRLKAAICLTPGVGIRTITVSGSIATASSQLGG